MQRHLSDERESPLEEALLVFYLRMARRRAHDAAVTEALCLLRNLDAVALFPRRAVLDRPTCRAA